MSMTDVHSARSLDEQVVAYFEYDEGCATTTDGIMPPPSGCSETVHLLYGFASWHIFSILIAVAFIGMLISMTMTVLVKDGGH